MIQTRTRALTEDFVPELTPPTPFPNAWLDDLAALDAAWQGGDAIAASEARAVLADWRQRLGRPERPEEEMLDIVTTVGAPLGWTAPRWFCHLTGLRHRVIHLLLTSPQGLLILQMRAHDKEEWPSLFDTTVGGHVKAGRDWRQGALEEIEEEMGLPAAEAGRWLVEGRLHAVGPTYERYAVSHDLPPLRNRQVNQIFGGALTEWGLAHLHFRDGEVAGAYLCHPQEARRMVETDFLIAPGLRHAFWRWREWQEEQRSGIGDWKLG